MKQPYERNQSYHRDIVPSGMYKGKHRAEVPDLYIYEVTSPISKYYSKVLANFFIAERARIDIHIKREIKKQKEKTEILKTFQSKRTHQAWRKPRY